VVDEEVVLGQQVGGIGHDAVFDATARVGGDEQPGRVARLDGRLGDRRLGQVVVEGAHHEHLRGYERGCQPAGTTPSCCRKPSVSQTSHVSAILPSSMRWMLMASTLIFLPVAGIPFTSPTWVPLPVHRTVTRSAVEKMSSMPQWPSTFSWYTAT